MSKEEDNVKAIMDGLRKTAFVGKIIGELDPLYKIVFEKNHVASLSLDDSGKLIVRDRTTDE